MQPLIIVGTAREGRTTIKVAEAVRDKFNQESHEPIFYDLKQKDIPPLGNRAYKENEEPVPEDIEELSQNVKNADAIVIVSPEYNHSYPGVLKNAMDYLYPEYEGKKFAYVTVSAGGFGGIRCLDKLKDYTLTLNGEPGPSIPVSNVNEKFSGTEIIDEEFDEKIEDFVVKLAKEIE